MQKRFRKGELKFYLGFQPKELTKYIKEHEENKQYVDQFLTIYVYNHVKTKWEKKPNATTTTTRFKRA